MVDMFSSLTDSLIVIIISYLPFREAARTSILSKRWRYIWRETKKIAFEESFFVNQESDEESKQIQKRVFIDFCKQWIETYPQTMTVNEFRLALSNPKEHAMDIEFFVRFAVDRGVKVLGLDFSHPNLDNENHVELFELPPFVYEHVGLESLTLFSCNFGVSLLNNFLALKTFSLGRVKLSYSSFKDLLSNLPLLENLSLNKCGDLEYIDISSTRLRSLAIEGCSDLRVGISIDVPNLRVFKYLGELIGFDIEYFNDMVEADIDFGLQTEFDDYGDLLYQLIGNFYRVRVLSVCSYMLQVIPSAEEYPSMEPPLYGVQRLTLKTALHVHEFHGITFFLSICPNLEFLTVDLVPSRIIFQERGTDLELGEHEFVSNYRFRRVHRCVKRSLKVVEFKGFKGERNEIFMINYLLCYGDVLDNLNIVLKKEKGPNAKELESSYRRNAQILLQMHKVSKSLCIVIR